MTSSNKTTRGDSLDVDAQGLLALTVQVLDGLKAARVSNWTDFPELIGAWTDADRLTARIRKLLPRPASRRPKGGRQK